jgi:hypothetical protein
MSDDEDNLFSVDRKEVASNGIEENERPSLSKEEVTALLSSIHTNTENAW